MNSSKWIEIPVMMSKSEGEASANGESSVESRVNEGAWQHGDE